MVFPAPLGWHGGCYTVARGRPSGPGGCVLDCSRGGLLFAYLDRMSLVALLFVLYTSLGYVAVRRSTRRADCAPRTGRA